MNNFLKKFKEHLISNIALIVVLICTIVHLTILTLNIFGVTEIVFYEGFNYLTAYLLIILCLVIFILGFLIEKITRLTIPQWFQVVFFVAFFIFTNTYYATNCYSDFTAMLFFYMYLSFISVITNLSVFYNVQRDEKNKLKVSKSYILTSIFFYSIGTNSIILFIASIIKAFAFPLSTLSKLSFFVADYTAMLIVTILMTIVYAISLSHSKKFINACLIKKNNQ